MSIWILAANQKEFDWIKYDIEFSELTTAYSPGFKPFFKTLYNLRRELFTYDNRKRLQSK